ncbi:hypothetical protein [Nocardia sp. NPDC052566]|uniref:hypothetical protein n=1 Tax=Nocardia sp. NPDC052566 TaxID=3364330 RepID=UPI0037CC51C7
MYFEEFEAAGALTVDIAEDLAALAGRYSSRITVNSGGRSVQALVLPAAWDVLRIRAGSVVSVTAEHGHRAAGDEDRLAIRDFVTRFQLLTGEVSSVRDASS